MDLSGIITKTIAQTPQDSPRRYIGASGIGKKCNRAIWYSYMGAASEAPPPSLKTSFDIGKRLEGLLLDYMEQAGLHIVHPSIENDFLLLQDDTYPLFQGHADAFLMLPDESPVVVEIKTAKCSSFKQFQNKGLRGWQETYYAQLQSYMGMSGYKRGVLLAVNKDTSELHHEWVKYDDIYYHELKTKARAIMLCEEPPEKINRSPLYFLCNTCSFKRVCHV
jgi:hypothetical protein